MADRGLVIVAILVGFFVLKMFFGGLRREAEDIRFYGLFWAAGIVHLTLRPIPRKLIAVWAVFLLMFMLFVPFSIKTYGSRNNSRALEGGPA